MKPELVPAFTGSSTIPTRLQGKKLLILGIDREKRDVLAPLIATVLHLLVNKNVANREDPLFLLVLINYFAPRVFDVYHYYAVKHDKE